MELISTERGFFELYKLVKDGCPEGQEVLVIGYNMSVDDLKALQDLIRETIDDGSRLYLAIPSNYEIIIQYYKE